MIRISLFRRLLSWLYPVTIRRTATSENPLLELSRYRGQWQLGTKDAIYSDGDRYRPLVLGFDCIRHDLPGISHVLLLGGGLGSGVMILHRMGYTPHCTLVEVDPLVLQWAEAVSVASAQVTYIAADAASFMARDTSLYGLIVVDIFKGRQVPAFVLTNTFLQTCRLRLQPGGVMLLNYIVNDKTAWQGFEQVFCSVFPVTKVISYGINRILTGYNRAD